ncbi:hypothetical protein BX666DRAFT_1924284 [Dichotomocladium elegans]|nr:hypothetical protein BX666DRAFT_1924284 [Dichotomocladium elegans]
MDYSQPRSILDSYESTEHVLLDSFKAAAVRVTNLYKDAMAQNRKAFGAGYQQALQDMFEFINTHDGGMMGIPSQSGVVAVDDLVGFAREKSAQLALELGSSENAAAAAAAAVSSSSSSTSASALTGEQDHNANAVAAAAALPMTKTASERHNDERGQGQESIASHHRSPIPSSTTTVDKNPFHIDPAAQFTFSAPPCLPRYSWTPSTTAWPGSTQLEMDSLKRRHAELTFMGRPLNNMDVDGSGEPAYKRGKPKQ